MQQQVYCRAAALVSLFGACALASVESDKSVPEQMLFSLVAGEPSSVDVWWTVSDIFPEFMPPVSQFTVRYGDLSSGLFNLTQVAPAASVTNVTAALSVPELFTMMVRARVTDLPPNASIALYANGFDTAQKFYRRGALSATHFLRTHPSGRWAPRLLFFGDLSDRGHVMPLVQLLCSAGRADAVFHAGIRTAHTFAHAPYLAAPGAPQGVWRYTGEEGRQGVPGGERWWSVDVGIVHVTSFDTSLWGRDTALLAQAVQWVRKDLERAAGNREAVPWVVVFARGAMFAGGDDGLLDSPSPDSSLRRVLKEFKVDLCVWGGGVKSYPTNYVRLDDAGTTHVTLATGRVEDAAKPAGAAAASTDRGFGVLTAEGPHRLRFDYRQCGWASCSGDKLDSVTLRRSAPEETLAMSTSHTNEEAFYSGLPRDVPSGESEELKNKIEALLQARQDLMWENRRLAKQLRQLGKKVKVPRDKRPGTAWNTPGWDGEELPPPPPRRRRSTPAPEQQQQQQQKEEEHAEGEEDGSEEGGETVIFTGPPQKKQQQPATPAPPATTGVSSEPHSDAVQGMDMLWASAGVLLLVVAVGGRMWRTKGGVL